jgi:hypothetical protein
MRGRRGEDSLDSARGKEILNIENQEIAKKNIGDYVEVTGKINEQTNTLHIDPLKMLSEGRAVCGLPKTSK